ncbi:uncharacterized protein [Miscanthus floridulus]|uniref:uncharacterized protein n=1 Tax=Miscanthus floridulus TaxID=154761 RepID=UPI003459FF09
MSSTNRSRKFESGFQKRKKKQRIEELVQSQQGAMDRFVTKQSQVSSDNPTLEAGALLEEGQAIDNNIDNDPIDPPENNVEVEEADNTNTQIDSEDLNPSSNASDSFQPDIFDPRYWDSLDSRQVDILAQKGPKRDLSIQKGPKDMLSRRFSSLFYDRILSNGESCDRDWLVYSKELDRVFCFSCKLFTKGHRKGQLANEGYNDWIHLGQRLKEHETSADHVLSMTAWYELRNRLQTDQTIDKAAQRQLEKEKDHWRKVLFRIVGIVKFLAKHNLAFRGSNSKLYDDSNGNFLGLVEMLAEFDPVIQEHVRRITNDETHVHYLGPRIQNELIHLLASAIKSEIIKKIKSAKYFSVILDCTPDVSHQEQMSLIIRYVDSTSGHVEESFLGFLDVNDTTGQALFDVLENELKILDLDIDNVRGQGYDNGSNMKGKHQGVQRKLLDVNPRAFYSACGCHSLNLTLCDMATKTCGRAKDFFGIIQRIYTAFANSTKKWQILKENITGLTLKSVSATRWESRIDSVKAIRFQCADIREALLQVSDIDNDPAKSSEAKGLANNELGQYDFIVAVAIWYEVLYAANLVSKQMQEKDMLIDGYRETGFLQALESAKEIALEMDIGTTFTKKRKITRKRHHDENPEDTNIATMSPEELFRIEYFNTLIDQAIVSLETRFEQYKEYQKNFGFLFTSETLRSLDNQSLKSSCDNLEAVLKKDEKSDIDAKELYMELKFLQDFIPEERMGPVEILRFLKEHGCFPNATIAYRVLLTIPVTVASTERSFSKLKLLKTYLRSTMTQERLNDLAIIALEVTPATSNAVAGAKAVTATILSLRPPPLCRPTPGPTSPAPKAAAPLKSWLAAQPRATRLLPGKNRAAPGPLRTARRATLPLPAHLFLSLLCSFPLALLSLPLSFLSVDPVHMNPTEGAQSTAQCMSRSVAQYSRPSPLVLAHAIAFKPEGNC